METEKKKQAIPSSVFHSLPIYQSSSESSDSLNKDTIIDQMQEKIGELLHTSEELCKVKNQLEILKETNSSLQTQLDQERQISSYKITHLEEDNNNKAAIIIDLKQKVADLSQNNEQLEKSVTTLQTRVEQISSDSENNINQQVLLQTNELKATLEMKNKELDEIKGKLAALKVQHSSSKESFLQEKIENERLSSAKEEKEKQNQVYKEEILSLQGKLTNVKKKYLQEKESNQKVIIDLNNFQNEVLRFKQKDEISKERIEKLDNDLTEAKAKIQLILSIQPSFRSVENVVDYFKAKNEECQLLKKELKTQRHTIKKFGVAIQNYESKLKTVQTNAAKTENVKSSLSSQCEEQLKEIKQMKEKMEHQKRRLSVMPVYENVNDNLRKRLVDIVSAVKPYATDLTLHNLMIFVVMLRRWKSLPGMPNAIVKDSRNWWWMNYTDTQKLTGDDVITLINQLRGEVEQLKTNMEQKQQQIEVLNQDLLSYQANSEKSAKIIKSNNERVAELENQISNLQILNEERVPNKEYDMLAAKLQKKKKKLYEAKRKAKEDTLEISNLQTDLKQTKQKLDNQCIITKQRERSLEDTKYQLYGAQNGLSHLQQGNNMKTKEILALERGIQKEQRTTLATRTQNNILALENRRLNFQVVRNNRMMSPPDHMSVDITQK